MDPATQHILNCLIQRHGFDFSGYRPAVIENRLKSRVAEIGCASRDEYLEHLHRHPEESKALIHRLVINVSKFFRNAFIFEYLYHRILPSVISRKIRANDPSFRVWSAGCASGEEPYSIAILLNELMKKESFAFEPDIFGTDIDPTILEKAQSGVYSFNSVKEVKYGWLKTYFTAENETFTLLPFIRDQVRFSVYDLLHKKTFAPPESVFGSFDLILCRNVLIYFQKSHQKMILDKLSRSLTENGCLVLGKAETLPAAYRKFFVTEDEYGRIYTKRS